MTPLRIKRENIDNCIWKDKSADQKEEEHPPRRKGGFEWILNFIWLTFGRKSPGDI